jgi:hypothetical protein
MADPMTTKSQAVADANVKENEKSTPPELAPKQRQKRTRGKLVSYKKFF